MSNNTINPAENGVLFSDAGVLKWRGPDGTVTALTATVITDEMIERGAVALINADGVEPYDREDGRWRPGVLAEAVLRAAFTPQSPRPSGAVGSHNVCLGPCAGKELTTEKDCTFIGIDAGADQKNVDGVTIIGDGISDLDPKHNRDALFIGYKVAIGKTLFGLPCNLRELIEDYVPPEMLTRGDEEGS